jgi:uncharacterized protein with HEPN domain
MEADRWHAQHPVHAYFDVNWRRVWEVLAHDIRPLKAGVEALLKAMEGEAP